jgi:hypothetical protein
MKVLYLTTPEEDYLQDSMLLGLRKILGENLVEHPKKEIMYKTCQKPLSEMYGKGFTIWQLLDDIEIDRANIDSKIKTRHFDLIIFGSIWRQRDLLQSFIKKGYLFQGNNFLFLDGEDYKRLVFWLMFSPYYKRERHFSTFCFTRKINFSIPQEKIRLEPTAKELLFAKHVQCDEAYQLEWIRHNCQKKYAFSNEHEYYENIARSYYAVTMKKAGWDCMRHYEIAANATVMAFFKLNEKPRYSAPHGLVDMDNVIAFNTAEELTRKMEYIHTNGLYGEIQKRSMDWAIKNSCESMARQLLEAYG